MFRLALLLVAVMCGATAYAVPIGIRARTEVTLEHRRDGGAVILSGRLVDDQSQPIVGENATLEITGLDPETRLTDSDGRFQVRLSSDSLSRLEGMHGQKLPWTVRFEGSSRLGSATAEGVLDLSKTSTRLLVQIAEPEVVRDDRNITVELALTAQTGPNGEAVAEAEVRLKVGDGKELVGKTGPSGRAAFVLRPTLLAGAGTYLVVARYLGNNVYAGSEGRAELRVLLPTRLNLRIAREGDERHGRYRFSGRLSDENGPVAHAAVIVRGVPVVSGKQSRRARNVTPAQQQPVFETLAATGDDGVYVAAVPALTLIEHGEQVVEVTAHYVPASDDTRHRGASSRAVNLDIPPAPGISLGWYALGLGIVAVLAAFAHALRTRFFPKTWAQLILAWRAFKLRFKKPILDVPDTHADPPFVTRVDDPEPGRVRRGDVFSGVVIDAHKRHPLAHARVRASSSDGVEHRADVDAAGRFTLGPLPPGAWVVRVEAKAWLGRELAVALPHGGDYDGAFYALVAVKRRMRDLFSDATHSLGAEVAWGFDTPREAAGRALERAPSPLVAGLPMGELTVLVERAHFAPDGVSEDDVERARVLREELP